MERLDVFICKPVNSMHAVMHVEEDLVILVTKVIGFG